MMWRVAYAVACVACSIAMKGCAANPSGAATASLGASLAETTFGVRSTFGIDQQKAREDAIIARAIAEHEMRHP